MKKLLLVDDSISILMSLQRNFKLTLKDQIEITTAQDGTEAVKLYSEQKFDLIITDYKMPELDGLEASKQILQNDPDAKIIFFTAWGDPKIIEEAKKCGIKAVIQKPSDAEILLKQIRELLGI